MKNSQTPSSPTSILTSMHRFSTLVKGSSSKEPGSLYTADNESKVSTIVREEPLPVPSLKVKRVDHYYSRWTKSWKYRVTVSFHPSAFSIAHYFLEHKFQGRRGDHPHHAEWYQRRVEGL